jgi:hypothetical protein
LLPDRCDSVLFENPTDLRAQKTRNLPNRHLNLSDKNLVAEAAGDLGRGCCFKKKRQSLDQVDSRFFNRRALAIVLTSIIAVKRRGFTTRVYTSSS